MERALPTRVALFAGEPLALSGTIKPTRLSLAYRLGLVIVAITMLLMPLLYFGLIVAASVAVKWHATANTWILSRGGVALWRLSAYLTPIIAGMVLVFFMVKPILARPGKSQDPLPIEPDAQPELFAFVEQICRQVRAPVPRRVQVDCQVNASASFMPGFLSLFKRDLVLTIGLPLAAGLSVRELGGVLAHEFGHFAQGAGMRLTALVRSINGWFARVVYERDEWDVKLEQWSQKGDWRIGIALVVARGAVWVSRRVLWALMMAGHFVSCFMLRQMEYDADSYEIGFAGSAAFAGTSARLRELNVGAQFGYHDLQQGWLQRKLPSDLPGFLIDRSGRLPDDLLRQLRSVPDAPTRAFDTHPSDADRVRAAEAAAAPGILVGGDGPATELFRDFEELSSAATRHHYEHDFGLSLESATLVGREVARRESANREENQRAIQHFFGDRISAYRPLRLDVDELASLSMVEIRTAWGQARQMMADAGEPISEHYRRYELLEQKRTQAFCAEELLSAGFDRVEAADFGLTQGTADEAVSAQASALTEQQALASSLERFESTAARRLSCCVCMLRSAASLLEDGVNRADRQALADEALSLVGALNAVAEAMPDVYEMGRIASAVRLLILNESINDQPALINHRMAILSARIGKCDQRLNDRLSTVPSPSAVTTEPITVAAWCGLRSGAERDSVSDVVDRLFTLHELLQGRLTSIALQVEAEESIES